MALVRFEMLKNACSPVVVTSSPLIVPGMIAQPSGPAYLVVASRLDAGQNGKKGNGINWGGYPGRRSFLHFSISSRAGFTLIEAHLLEPLAVRMLRSTRELRTFSTQVPQVPLAGYHPWPIPC